MNITGNFWPTNKHGTTWRRAVMFFHWSDEAVVDAAIESINPLKITVRSTPVAIGSASGDGRLSLRRLADMLEDDDAHCIIIHPCRHPELFRNQVGGIDGGEGWFHVVGIAWLDLADAATCEALQTALNERRQWFGSDVPYIEF